MIGRLEKWKKDEFQIVYVEDDAGEKDYFAKYNAVAILLPYARSWISNYTANENAPSLILPPMIDNE